MSYNVRTFRAPSMPEALAAIKRELGPSAVILGTRQLPADGLKGWARRQRVEVTVAPPEARTPAPRVGAPAPAAATPLPTVSPPPAPASPEQAEKRPVPKALYPYYVRLVQNDVAEDLAARLVREAAKGLPTAERADNAALARAVRNYVARMIPDTPGIALTDGQPRRVALVGPSGCGKSTTLAKLAALYRLRHDRRVALLSLDMRRLDAHAQMARYADVLEIPLRTAQTITEVKQARKELGDVDLLLIDTPGVSLHEQALFARMATLLRAARPDEIHLVLPASLDSRVQARIARGFLPLDISRVVLTRLDDAIGLGVVLNVIEQLELGVSFLATGQNVPNDLEQACGGRIAELLCATEP